MRPCKSAFFFPPVALLTACACLGLGFAPGVIRAQESPPAHRGHSVTIYPIVFTPANHLPDSISTRVAEVVGLLLERAGMQTIEIAAGKYTPPETDDMTALATDFATFVTREPLKTEYALLGKISGTAASGITAVPPTPSIGRRAVPLAPDGACLGEGSGRAQGLGSVVRSKNIAR